MSNNNLNPSNIVGRTTITEGNYDFYETPQRATHTTPNNTIDGYDFTADVMDEAQTVNDKAVEDIEININNTNIINNYGVEKQVSPTPLDNFEF